MPCFDSRSTYEYGKQESQAEINKLTRLLCEAMNKLEGGYGLDTVAISTELKKWWDNHKKVDERRAKSKLAYKNRVRRRR